VGAEWVVLMSPPYPAVGIKANLTHLSVGQVEGFNVTVPALFFGASTWLFRCVGLGLQQKIETFPRSRDAIQRAVEAVDHVPPLLVNSGRRRTNGIL
jgi:hypothetical protein